jgi:hypothetical protein
MLALRTRLRTPGSWRAPEHLDTFSSASLEHTREFLSAEPLFKQACSQSTNEKNSFEVPHHACVCTLTTDSVQIANATLLRYSNIDVTVCLIDDMAFRIGVFADFVDATKNGLFIRGWVSDFVSCGHVLLSEEIEAHIADAVSTQEPKKENVPLTGMVNALYLLVFSA